MARPFPVAVRSAGPERAPSLESRLQALAQPLKHLDAPAVARQFSLPHDATLVKTTLSVCPQCLDHVQAAV